MFSALSDQQFFWFNSGVGSMPAAPLLGLFFYRAECSGYLVVS